MTDKEKKICEKYSAYDETGHVHCNECPLVTDPYNCICKAVEEMDKQRYEDEVKEKKT